MKMETKSGFEFKNSVTFCQSHTRLYNELEFLGQNSVVKINVRVRNKKETKNSKTSKLYAIFVKSMRIMLLWGQFIGVMPIAGTAKEDPRKLRFSIKSWRFAYSVILLLTELVITVLCIKLLFGHPFGIKNFAFAYFYAACNFTTFIFLLMANKWPALCRKIETSCLDEYVDYKVKRKCAFVTLFLIVLSIVEHILAIIYKSTYIMYCNPDEDFYKAFSEFSFPWLYESGVEYNFCLGILLQLLNFIYTMNWNFSDIFIICISMYLTSILNKINEKIMNFKDKNLPPSFWRSLRLDYTRATKLVRHFDDVISNIIFTAFAINLFFICLQLFNILSNGLKVRVETSLKNCPNLQNGICKGHEKLLYLTYSLLFLLGRSTAVLLIAADVHSATLVPAEALFDVPYTGYCEEVQRFIDQVTNHVVALSGLRFFSVTRNIVLPVAGSIVTYELVLLQFSS